MSELVFVVLGALAAYRLTRIITTDKITEPFFESLRYRLERRWVRAKFRKGTITDEQVESGEWQSKLAFLLSCPWCLGFWVSAVFAVVLSVANVLDYPMLSWLAMSTLVGFLGRIDSE